MSCEKNKGGVELRTENEEGGIELRAENLDLRAKRS